MGRLVVDTFIMEKLILKCQDEKWYREKCLRPSLKTSLRDDCRSLGTLPRTAGGSISPMNSALDHIRTQGLKRWEEIEWRSAGPGHDRAVVWTGEGCS